MATITDIENEIGTEVQAKFGFDLNTTSNAGDWKLLRGIVAQAIFTVYTFFESFKSDIAVLAQATEFGNARWWQNRVLEFQYGDSLSEQDGRLYYPILDPAKQIVKRVAIIEKVVNQILVVQIKVAKLAGVDSVPLSDLQKTALEFYVLDIKPAGVPTQVINLDADEVAISETIYYDGKLVLADFEVLILAAREAYLAGIVFNGQFNVNLYRDALEAVCGQGNADIHSVQIKKHGGDYVSVSRVYDPESGHYKLIEADCNFNYIPV